jgi:hypothetical protein
MANSNSPTEGLWKPSAVVYWKSKWQKHVSFLNPRERFDSQGAALFHAMVFATRFCDEHFIH